MIHINIDMFEKLHERFVLQKKKISQKCLHAKPGISVAFENQVSYDMYEPC